MIIDFEGMREGRKLALEAKRARDAWHAEAERLNSLDPEISRCDAVLLTDQAMQAFEWASAQLVSYMVGAFPAMFEDDET